MIVSADTDFGRLLAIDAARYPSVIFFRGGTGRRPGEQMRLLLTHMEAIRDQLDAGCVAVFEPERVRVRVNWDRSVEAD